MSNSSTKSIKTPQTSSSSFSFKAKFEAKPKSKSSNNSQIKSKAKDNTKSKVNSNSNSNFSSKLNTKSIVKSQTLLNTNLKTGQQTSTLRSLGSHKPNSKYSEGGVVKLHKMITPLELIKAFSLSDTAYEMIDQTRQDIVKILQQQDDRLVVIVGPCSIHDPQAGLEYATKLSQILSKYTKDLCIVMRVYFEKPRTTIGWKGLINDPRLDDSYKINEGIAKARKLLVAINELGVPCAGEFLDNLVPQYLADLMSWGAIGARTTESQLHRELASGISCPIGFKNTTNGGVRESIDAIMSASRPHTFLGINPTGKIAIIETAGNPHLHVILRGGSHGTNFDQKSVKACCQELSTSGFRPQVMIDFSHANSQKDYRKQALVLQSVYQQLTQTLDLTHAQSIMGVMIESNLVAGKQQLTAQNREQLVYGQSITDGCISWEETENFLDQLAQAVQLRRHNL